MKRALFVIGLVLAFCLVLMTCVIAKTESINIIKCDETECTVSKDDLKMLLEANHRAKQQIIELREQSARCNHTNA